jgi:predicted PurR-regulated permease PerM
MAESTGPSDAHRVAPGNQGAVVLDDGSPGSHMPKWVPKVILLSIVSVAAALGTWQIIKSLRDLIIWLVISLFLSFALEPGVNWLTAHGWRRGLATAVLLFGLFIIGVVLVASMIPLVIQQIRDLIENVPNYIDQISNVSERWFSYKISSEKLVEQLQSVNVSLADYARNLAGNLLGVGAAVLGAIFQLFTIGLFTFYLVADGPRLRRTVCSVLPPERQREVLWAWDVAVEKTGGYLYSRLLLAAISGTATFLVLTILGVPYALPLALYTGLLSQFIPVVGTYLAAIVPLLVALLDRPVSALILAIYFVVYQQIENYVLSPRITARTMQLHPAVAFAAAIAGGSLMGAIGAFLALPAAAIVQAGLSTYLTRHEVLDTEWTRDEVVEEAENSENSEDSEASGDSED